MMGINTDMFLLLNTKIQVALFTFVTKKITLTQNTDKTVSIIITTYNGAKWIEECIASCQKSNYPARIIVVDNNSTDNTLDLLPNDVHLLTLSKNVGFGRANNIGMMEAIEKFGSDYVFLLNQDAYIKEDTIGELVECHQANPKLGLISPLHFDGQEQAFDYRFKIYMKRAQSSRISDGLYASKFVNAAAWFMTKDAVLKNGGFDPVFFHTGEDDNFCQRLRYHKIPIAITESARIMHDRQDRKKAKTPPHLKVANRAKIIIFNPDANLLTKCIQLIPLAFYFLMNLTVPTYRKREKLQQDYQGFKDILSYNKSYKRNYNQDSIFLKQDYPPSFIK